MYPKGYVWFNATHVFLSYPFFNPCGVVVVGPPMDKPNGYSYKAV